MPVAKYKSSLAEGSRVLFQGREHHPRNGHYGTILGALPNPSQRPENQWYDVRFEDQSIGRSTKDFCTPKALLERPMSRNRIREIWE